MDKETALGIERHRREVEKEVDDALKAATEAEAAEAAAAEEAGTERPSARKRFRDLGERIMALADDRESIKVGDKWAGELHTGTLGLGGTGLSLSVRARESYTPGSLRGSELAYVRIDWKSEGYTADSPFARQAVSHADVQGQDVAPEVFGMLHLMEQSVEVAEETLREAAAANT